MDKLVYSLCSLLTLFCSVMLTRGYLKSGARLLLWSAIFFAVFTFSNVVLYVDLVILPVETDLSIFRTLVTLIGVVVLLFGLIWESV